MLQTIKEHLLAKVAVFLIAVTAITCAAYTDTAEAATFSFPSSEIEESAEESFSLTWSDIDSFVNNGFAALSSWLSKGTTDIWVKTDSDGNVSYYFNTPSIQKLVTNYAQQLNTGGWSVPAYLKTEEQEDSSTWVTAEKKYGYNLPHIIYSGEMPALTVGLNDIVDANTGVFKTVSVAITGLGYYFLDLLDWLFGTDLAGEGADVLSFSTDMIKSITYNTSDYITTESSEYYEELGDWLVANWSSIKNLDIEIEIDDVDVWEAVLSDGETPGVNVTGTELVGRIISTAGSSYKDVFDAIISAAEEKGISGAPSSYVLRNMPYDLSSMSDASKEYMGNISDPRVEMFVEEGSGTIIGIATQIYSAIIGIIGYWPTDIVGTMMYFASLLDSMTSFKWLTGVGLDPTMLWQGTVGQMIMIMIIILSLISLVAIIAKWVSGGAAKGGVVTKAIFSFLTMAITVVIMINPSGWSTLITNTLDKVISIGTSTLEYDDTFSELYDVSADSQQISSLRYWYLYANTWSAFVTNHSISSDASVYDESQESSGHNEYVDWENPAELASGKKINLWPIIAIELAENNDEASLYRVTDHYMAPLIIATNSSGTQFTVESNEFYNGFICMSLGFVYILIAFAVLVLVAMKFLVFLELAMEVLLLFVKVMANSLGTKIDSPLGSFKGALKNVVGALGKIIAYDVMITLFIWIAVADYDEQVYSTMMQVIFCGVAIYYFVFLMIIKGRTREFLTPKILQAVREGIGRGAAGIRQGISTVNEGKPENLQALEKSHLAAKVKIEEERGKLQRGEPLNNDEEKGKNPDNEEAAKEYEENGSDSGGTESGGGSSQEGSTASEEPVIDNYETINSDASSPAPSQSASDPSAGFSESSATTSGIKDDSEEDRKKSKNKRGLFKKEKVEPSTNRAKTQTTDDDGGIHIDNVGFSDRDGDEEEGKDA